MNPNKFPRIEVAAADELWAWLLANHAVSDSVWLVTWKAEYREKYVSREEVLDALTAHGWIDGRHLDDADARQGGQCLEVEGCVSSSGCPVK